MRQRRQILGVILVSVILAVYIGFALHRVWILILTGDTLGALMGGALLVFSLIATWALQRELRFGVHANRLTRRLETEGELPEDGLEAQWNGMPTRQDAAAVVPQYAAATEVDPQNWRAWQRYGILLRAAGEYGPARKAIRTAIALEREHPRDGA